MDLLATHSNPKYHEHSNTTKIQKEQDREEGKILIRARVRVLCNLLRQASPISVKRWRREFKSLAKGVESDPDFWELVGASTGVLGFGLGLLCVYLTMPASDYSVLKLPRSIEDLRILRDQLESYTVSCKPRLLKEESLLNYMLFLRVTPTLPNTFINVASPIVDVPYHIFFLATLIGLIPAAYVTVRAGIALGELRSIGTYMISKQLWPYFSLG
ncbi:hypothetical protein MRB53_019332 [Persea americana]|uniref:Uncharacterized protein n=1 Tax=Persea americana TaxID=3435 RepID=A0ACC2KXX8_PERAE|nr:hypothetical protein MRB53_019332 [Persea americana]